MIFCTLQLLALLAAVGAQSEIRRLELDGSYLIAAGANKFAIASPNLFNNNWKTVSINGNELVAITATCQTFVKDVNHLRDSEKGPIQQAKSQLEMHANSNFQQLSGANHKFCDCRYSFEGNQQSCSNCNSGTSNYQNDQYSVSKAGDNSFAISKPSLIANMARLFVDDDLFTVVYRDGTVKMRPIACLSSEEKQIIEDGRLLVQKAEEKFNQEMEEFGRNLDQQLKRQQQDLKEMNIKLQEDMEKMNKRLQQDLEKMENDLKNKFSNGFPFN